MIRDSIEANWKQKREYMKYIARIRAFYSVLFKPSAYFGGTNIRNYDSAGIEDLNCANGGIAASKSA